MTVRIKDVQAPHRQIVDLKRPNARLADHQTTDCERAQGGGAERQSANCDGATRQCTPGRCFRSQMSGWHLLQMTL